MQGLAKIPQRLSNVSKVFKALPGKLKKLQNNTLAYVLSANTYIEIARYTDGGTLLIDKWLDTGEEILGKVDDININDEFTDALELIKRSNGTLGWRLAFKEGLERDAEVVNDYFVKFKDASPPYKIGSKVKDMVLKPGDKIYVVEYAQQVQLGGWASKLKINSIEELRNDLAVLKDWKNPDIDDIVVREYIIKKRLSVRSGEIGPQKEVINGIELNYPGGGHQYEFMNNWKVDDISEYLNLSSETIIN
jgi:hypothetical protein